METTNELKDIEGLQIEEGQDIFYINNPEKVFLVIKKENELGHTVKFKDDKFCYQPFLLFLKKDDLLTFKII